MNAVLLYGPEASGKTLIAEKLAKHLGLKLICDDFNPFFTLKPELNTLYITNYFQNAQMFDKFKRKISINEAMKMCKTSLKKLIKECK